MSFMNSKGGKGSAARPLSVDSKTYGDNYDAIFRKKKEVQPEEMKEEVSSEDKSEPQKEE